jgi:hypothetical protein
MPHILPDVAVTHHSTWDVYWPFSWPIKRERITSGVSEYVWLAMVQIIQELDTSNLDEPRCGPPTVVQECVPICSATATMASTSTGIRLQVVDPPLYSQYLLYAIELYLRSRDCVIQLMCIWGNTASY